ncbi:MAG: hypothetical protein ACLRSD_16260 [Oscillibacter sp.]
MKTIKVEEFPSVGVGGLRLWAGTRASRSSSVWARARRFSWANTGRERDPSPHRQRRGRRRIHFAGPQLAHQQAHQYALIRKLCQDGRPQPHRPDDGRASRASRWAILPPEATAANPAGGRRRRGCRPDGKMLGIVNLVLQSIGTVSVLACKVLRHGHGRPHRRADDAAATAV